MGGAEDVPTGAGDTTPAILGDAVGDDGDAETLVKDVSNGAGGTGSVLVGQTVENVGEKGEAVGGDLEAVCRDEAGASGVVNLQAVAHVQGAGKLGIAEDKWRGALEAEVVSLIGTVGDGRMAGGAIPVENIALSAGETGEIIIDDAEVNRDGNADAAVVCRAVTLDASGAGVVDLNAAVRNGGEADGPVLRQHVTGQAAGAGLVGLIGTVWNCNENAGPVVALELVVWLALGTEVVGLDQTVGNRRETPSLVNRNNVVGCTLDADRAVGYHAKRDGGDDARETVRSRQMVGIALLANIIHLDHTEEDLLETSVTGGREDVPDTA